MGEFFKREVFRPVATVLVPGVIGLSPYAIQLLLTYPALAEFATANAGATVVVSLVFSVTAGLVFEDIGARVEVQWDKILDRAKTNDRLAGEHRAFWDRYLALTMEKDPIGQNYLRSILLRLKFELGVVVAIPVAWIGFLWLDRTRELWASGNFRIGTVMAAVFWVYMIFESFESARTLGKVRRLVVDCFDPPPGTEHVAV